MSECNGLLGKWFGHCFVKFPIKTAYKQPYGISYDVHGIENVKEFLNLQREIYEIRCTRCGVKPDV